MEWLDSSKGSRRRLTARLAASGTAFLLLVALTGCSGGGGKGGGGGGNQNQLIVIINPSSSFLQLNQTLQMSAAVVNAPTLTIAANGAVRVNNVVTITTTQPHGFVPGLAVAIQGVTDTSFIGTFTIVSVPSATTFTYAQTAADASSGGGMIPQTAVRWQVNGTEGGSAATGTISATGLYTAPASLPPAVTATIAANGAVRMGNTVTITTTAAHTFVAGQVVTILGVADPPALTATIAANGIVRSSNIVTVTTTAAHGLSSGQVITITGVSDNSFNSVFVISSTPNATTFTFFQAGSDATSGGGMVSTPGTAFNGTFSIASVPSSTTFTYSQVGTNATSGNGTVSSSAVQITAVSVADSSVTGTASIGLDSGIILSLAPTSVSLATNDTIQFAATNSGATNTTIDWFVNSMANGNATVGQICVVGSNPCAVPTGNTIVEYRAPAAVPNPASVTVRAQAAADPTKLATAIVTVFSGTTVPTLTSVWPTIVAQGAAQQDFYLEGTDFLSTTIVRFNGTQVANPVRVSATLLRVRVPAGLLDAIGSVPFQIDTQQPQMTPIPPINVTLTPQRPALVGTLPDSLPPGSGVVTVDFHGGYFSATGGVTTEFDGGPAAPIPVSSDPSRQLQVTLNAGNNNGPGLYTVGVRNPAATPQLAVGNLALKPSSGSPPATTTLSVGSMPSSVAVNTVTGTAVVLNSGVPSLSLIDLATDTVTGTIMLTGSNPTGVAVDSMRNWAIVANNGSDTISIINLATGLPVTPAIPSPTPAGLTVPLKPFAVGVNPRTGIALIANQSANQATILDLTSLPPAGALPTISLGTGTNPAVAVEPRLNWAIVTPGGTGTLTIVNLGGPGGAPAPAVVANVLLGSTVRGIAINTETRRALLTDPASRFAQVFSVLDQTVTQVNDGGQPMEQGFVAAAVNPFTDVGVATNVTTDMVSVFDLQATNRFSMMTFAAGTDPVAVAIDPGSNKAVIANQADGTVTIANLGPIRPLHVLQVDPPLHILPSPPAAPADVALTVTGFGFTPAAVVRADEAPLNTTVVSSRQLTAVLPATMLTGPQRFAIDVLDMSGGSNVIDLPVIQAITVGSAAGAAPKAVAIDQQRDLAVVTNSGTGEASIVDLNTFAVSANVSVGNGTAMTPANPQGVAIYSRGGTAVVSNRGTNNVSILDIEPTSMTFGTVLITTAVGTEPIGVAVNNDNGEAVVANSVSNSLSFVDAVAGGVNRTATVSPDVRPVAVAVDPVRNQAAVANSASNSVAVVDMATPLVQFRVPNVQGANGIMHDPVSDRFIAVAGLGNNISVIDPATRQSVAARVGINPTSIAYNNNSTTLVTVNTASNTISVMDFIDRRIRAIIPLSVSGTTVSQGGVAIHPRTNIAVVADTPNDRILLVPLPR